MVAVFTTVSHSHGAVLVDLSSTGARMRSDELPRLGEELMVTIETIRAFGTVAWIDGDQFGVAFDVPVSTGELMQLKRRLTRTAGLAPELNAAMEDWNTGMAR